MKGQEKNSINDVIQKSWIGDCFVSKISKVELMDNVKTWILDGRKNMYITAINVSKFVRMRTDRKMAAYIKTSPINIADGFPIFLATKLLGDPIPERITGVDFMEDLLGLADKHGFKVFFLGSKPHVLNTVVDMARKKFSGIRIAGKRDGYFKDEEIEDVIQEIALSEPDILLIALGLPQKEYFVDDHLKRLNASVILPVGGGFDVFAGEKKRAPRWVQNAGIEWLWRSVYDRSRAMLVYKSALNFIFMLAGEFVRRRMMKKRMNNVDVRNS